MSSTGPSAHPFRFSTTSNGSHSGGSEYTTGVTHNSSTQVTIVVASGAPTLYYYCSSHSGMGGQANTPVPANNTLQVITTNQGQDNITNAQYNLFSDTLFSASGFTFSLNSKWKLNSNNLKGEKNNMATIDIGKIKPVFKGAYDNSTAYVLDDIVYYNGSSYVAKDQRQEMYRLMVHTGMY